MQFIVRRQTLIGDILWADPYGYSWGWLSETNTVCDIVGLSLVCVFPHLMCLSLSDNLYL